MSRVQPYTQKSVPFTLNALALGTGAWKVFAAAAQAEAAANGGRPM